MTGVISRTAVSLAILSVTALAALAAVPAPAATLVVDRDGSGDFRGIAESMARAVKGDTIVLRAGVYEGGFRVPSGLAIKAEPGAQIVLGADQVITLRGGKNVNLSGLSITKKAPGKPADGSLPAILIADSKLVRIEFCRVLAGFAPAISIRNSVDIHIDRCLIVGEAESAGIEMSGNGLSISNNVISRTRVGIRVVEGNDITISDNLLDNNGSGAEITGSVNIVGNTVNGPGAFGIMIFSGDVVVWDNTVRRTANGIVAHAAARGIIRNNTISQNDIGMVLGGNGYFVLGNNITDNREFGVVLSPPGKIQSGGKNTVLRQNMISGNGGPGIFLQNFPDALIYQNLLENNSQGLLVTRSRAEILNNTIVLNKSEGISIGDGSTVAVMKNIIANNSTGIFLGAAAKMKSGGNVVFGNILAGQGATLGDGNYAKNDWLPTRGGDRILVGVFPALDIKSESDLTVDPGFAALGSDYRLRKDSPLVKKLGNGDLPGAFPVMDQ